jgi:hypothetical protein
LRRSIAGIRHRGALAVIMRQQFAPAHGRLFLAVCAGAT